MTPRASRPAAEASGYDWLVRGSGTAMSGDGADPSGTPIRINVRPLASPLPLGLFSFGVGMLLLAAQTAGWVPVGQASQVGLLLAAFVFPLEAVATIIAFLARDVLAATVLGLFS